MVRLTIILLAMSVAACIPATRTTLGPETAADPSTDLYWPPHPNQERIRYLRSFSAPSDLGYRQSFSRRLKDMLGGGTFQGMIRPYAIAVDQRLTLVADPGLSAVHVFNHAKRSFKLLESVAGHRLSSPVGVALGEDRLFIVDSALARVFVLDREFRLLRELDDFMRPTGVAYDVKRGRLYVADTLAHRIVEMDENGETLRTFGERGIADGQFNFPTHLAVSETRLFINDTMNFRIQVFELVSGAHLASIGEHGDSMGYLAQPKGIARSPGGPIFIAESISNRIQIFSLNGQFLLGFGNEGTAPGQFRFPAGMAIRDQHLYVADSGNRRIQIFRYLGDD